jgi:hypothetical protein
MAEQQGGLSGGAYTEQFERLRGHTPPHSLAQDYGRTPGRRDDACRTRSELLAQRKQLYIDSNEDRKRAHEEAHPIWAATVAAPREALKPSYNRTRTILRNERRQDRVATAVLLSGDEVLERDKRIMLASDPTALVTTISRPHAYGAALPMAYVEHPDRPTRSSVLAARKHELLAANAQTMRAIGAGGYRSFYQRVDDRLDSSLKTYYDAKEALVEERTRGQLIAQRKADALAENQAFLRRHRAGEVREPNYADQAEPFWTLGREVAQPAVNSRTDLLETQQWYRKPEVYIPGRSPRLPDPFKPADGTRLVDKLSSGPITYQRGYPAAKGEIAGKIGTMAAPDASALVRERKAKQNETLRFIDFRIRAERTEADMAGGDFVMKAPVYSSFARDGIFREPARAARAAAEAPARAAGADAAERRGGGGGSGGTLSFATPRPAFAQTAAALDGSSPMLMSTRLPAKPGTAASVRSGGFQAYDSLGATIGA